MAWRGCVTVATAVRMQREQLHSTALPRHGCRGRAPMEGFMAWRGCVTAATAYELKGSSYIAPSFRGKDAEAERPWRGLWRGGAV